MCRRVQAAIAEAHQPGIGSVRQALCGALYEEVTDFYRLIAVLEGQLSAPMPTPGEAVLGFLCSNKCVAAAARQVVVGLRVCLSLTSHQAMALYAAFEQRGL